MPKIVAALALTLVATTAVAGETHPAFDAVHGYAPRAAISETAGDKQVVGYFETADTGCRMTLMMAEKDDETLAVTPVKLVFDVAAADVAEIQAGDRGALMVACSADADQVKIAAFGAAAM